MRQRAALSKKSVVRLDRAFEPRLPCDLVRTLPSWSDMDATEEHLDVLQNLESVVVAVWRENRAMADYTVMRAYDAAIAHYVAVARQQSPEAVNLTCLDATLYDVIKSCCEWRLGKTTQPGQPVPPAIPVEELVGCLKKLRKSVDRWNRTGGRQGYLQFIEKFLP